MNSPLGIQRCRTAKEQQQAKRVNLRTFMKIHHLFLIVLLVAACRSTQHGTTTKPKSTTSQVVEGKKRMASADEDFDFFYKRFHEDPIFQLQRIHFPIKGAKVENEKLVPWTKENWQLFKVRADEVDQTQYKVEVTKTDTRVKTRVYIPNSDADITTFYEKIKGKWFLVQHDDVF